MPPKKVKLEETPDSGTPTALSEVHFSDFKSFKQARLFLEPLTLLVGANASGKSNAIEGLRFLSLLAQGKTLTEIQQIAHQREVNTPGFRGGLHSLPRSGSTQFGLTCLLTRAHWQTLTIRFQIQETGLALIAESLTDSTTQETLYALDPPIAEPGLRPLSDVWVTYNNFSQGPNKPKARCSNQLALFRQLLMPGVLGAKHKKTQELLGPVVRDFQSQLAQMFFLDAVPARMRDYSYISDAKLWQDGANLSSVLYALCNQKPARSGPLLDFIKSLPEQDILSIQFLEGPRGDVIFALEESFGGVAKATDAASLSDGTLRVLAVAAAILSAPEGSLVVIEEIDNGIHPSRAKHLLTQLIHHAQRRSLRILLTTHNPALVDALPPEMTGHVSLCYRTEDGNSTLVRLEDLEAYPDLIVQGPLGYLMTSGRLDRFVKTYPDAETRKQQARQWLQRLREA